MDTRPSSCCLLQPKPETRLFQPQAEDILSDEELLDLFRVIKLIIRKRPDAERMAKLLFCISYSLGDHVKYYRPAHDDTVIFRDDLSTGALLHAVRLSHNPSCCDIPQPAMSSLDLNDNGEIYTIGQRWKHLGSDTDDTNYSKQLSVSYLTRVSPTQASDSVDMIDNIKTSSVILSAPEGQQRQQPYQHRHQHEATDHQSPPHSMNNGQQALDKTVAINKSCASSSASSSSASSSLHTSNGLLNLTCPSSSSGLTLLDHTPSSPHDSYDSHASVGGGGDVLVNVADSSTVRSYTHFRPLYSASLPFDYTQSHHPASPMISSLSSCSSISSPPNASKYQQLNSMLHGPMTNTRIQPDPASNQVVMEPRQRGFYYQYGRIDREPPLLRRFAEQGVLTQASLLRKRKRQSSDTENPYVLTTLPAPAKKPKIPHRHGEFEQRRDDIIQRMRSITLTDLEQKSQRLAPDSTLAIELADLPSGLQVSALSPEDAAELLEPALRILTFHSNMKPHLDNGMNQNGIYYNSDYYRLYLAFVQFQKVFATLFPQEVVKIRSINASGNGDDDEEYDPLAIPIPPSSHTASVSAMSERDRDRDRNMNMKAYRGWIEPLLTETNWAAFRRNIVVGERMVLLTKVIGQGVLLMTKELSGSKLHLTFTNSEWDEFIGGLHIGKWDDTVNWDNDNEDINNGNDDHNNDNVEGDADLQGKKTKNEKEKMEHGKSRLVEELKDKFMSEFWFYEDGTVVPSHIRKRIQERRKHDQAEGFQQQQKRQRQISPIRLESHLSSSSMCDVPTRSNSSSSNMTFSSATALDSDTTATTPTTTTTTITTAGQIETASTTAMNSMDGNDAGSLDK